MNLNRITDCVDVFFFSTLFLIFLSFCHCYLEDVDVSYKRSFDNYSEYNIENRQGPYRE